MICLITKKGYNWFSGYKFKRDPRGFDILPDATHGTSGWMDRKEMEQVVDLGSTSEMQGILLGKLKDDPDDDDKYSEYVAQVLRTTSIPISSSTAPPVPVRPGAS